MRLNHLALFNGIGGFQLAAHHAGWINKAHVEIDPYCNLEVIGKLFPESACHWDIKDFDGKQYYGAIDIISGGDPCQPSSVAGLGKGTSDDRYLWPEMFRVIRDVSPAWIVNENVTGTISNGILDLKIDDLEGEGYTCGTVILPAESVGAVHKRYRVWLIAHDPNRLRPDRTSGKFLKAQEKEWIRQRDHLQFFEEPVDLWPVDWHPLCKHRKTGEIGPTVIRQSKSPSRFFGFGPNPYGHIPRYILESGIVRSLDGLPEGLDYTRRNKRLHALGNAIVWQVAYEIFQWINEQNAN